MPTWITGIIVPLATVTATLAAQFYFKWVPDIEKQKRHVRVVAWLLFDVVVVASNIYVLFDKAQYKGPVSPSFVVHVGIDSASMCFNLVFIALRRAGGLFWRHLDNFDRLTKNFGRHLDFTDRQIEVSKVHQNALLCLASDPHLSPRTIEALKTILDEIVVSA